MSLDGSVTQQRREVTLEHRFPGVTGSISTREIAGTSDRGGAPPFRGEVASNVVDEPEPLAGLRLRPRLHGDLSQIRILGNLRRS